MISMMRGRTTTVFVQFPFVFRLSPRPAIARKKTSLRYPYDKWLTPPNVVAAVVVNHHDNMLCYFFITHLVQS